MHVQVLEWSALLKIIDAKKAQRQFDAVIIGWSLGIDPDSYSIWHSSQYPGGLNLVGYNYLIGYQLPVKLSRLGRYPVKVYSGKFNPALIGKYRFDLVVWNRWSKDEVTMYGYVKSDFPFQPPYYGRRHP